MRLCIAQANLSPLLETQLIEVTLTGGQQGMARGNSVCEEQHSKEQIVYSRFERREDFGIFCQEGSIILRHMSALHLADA